MIAVLGVDARLGYSDFAQYGPINFERTATIAALLARSASLSRSPLSYAGPLDPDGRRNESGDPAGGRPLWRQGGSEVLSLVAGEAGGALQRTLREMVEMHYLWRLPVRLRNDKLVDFLGAEPHTPLDSAVYQTLQGLGCLPAGAINQEAGEA